MKKILSLFAFLLSFNACALDAYSSADEGVKTLIKAVMTELKLEESLETEKKIFNAISFVFTDDNDWNSYWLGYNDLGDSKITNPSITYIEQFINTSDKGMFFLSFLYDKRVNQILLSTKQIRHGSDKEVLDVFSGLKSDDEYEVSHEEDSYALTQKSGWVDFAGFSVMGGTAAIVYFDQVTIDL